MSKILSGIRDGFLEGMRLACVVAILLPAKFLETLINVIKAFVLKRNFDLQHVEMQSLQKRIEEAGRQQHKERIAAKAVSALQELEPAEHRRCA